MYRIEHYLTPGKLKDSYATWLRGLRGMRDKV